MRISDVILANYVEVRSGLAYIAGAFPEWWEVPTLPAPVSIQCLVVLELDADEVGTPIAFQAALQRPRADRELLFSALIIRAPSEVTVEGAPLRHFMAFPVAVFLGSIGRHDIIISVGDQETAVGLGVRVVPNVQQQQWPFGSTAPPPAPQSDPAESQQPPA